MITNRQSELWAQGMIERNKAKPSADYMHTTNATCEVCEKSTTLQQRTYTCDRCHTTFKVFWQCPVTREVYNNLKNEYAEDGKTFSAQANIIHIHEYTPLLQYRQYDMPCANCNPWWNRNTYNRAHSCDCCNPVNW